MYHFLVSLLAPLPFLLLLLGVTLLLVRFRCEPRRGMMRFMALIYLLLVAISLPAVSYLALGSLEWQYAPNSTIPADRKAIVVLSGYLREVQNDTETVLGDDTLYRCLKATRLYQLGDPCPVIVSGGEAHLNDPSRTLAEAMKEFLVSHGVKPEDIIVEAQSSSTYENAVETAKLIRAHEIASPILLVTDITHLMRSERCFERQRIEVVPVGCRFSEREFEWSYDQFIPSPHAVDSIHEVAHEWMGMAWYKLRDRI